MPPTLYLIDGHALAYRMYFALTAGTSATRWQNSKGEPTAGTYGFARELMRLLEQERPDYLAVAFDTGKTFRDKLFPEYKATRAKMPDDLRPQMERIRQLVDAFNIPRLEMEGYEADDVLGSVLRSAAVQGLGVKIITGDRDLLQLVNARTAVYLAGDEQNYVTEEDVHRKLGVRPDQVVDYKALVGDKSDNIPGVAGVGEKTAVALLEKFGSLDRIYEHLADVEKRWSAKLEAGRESAYLSYKLAKIETDLSVPFKIEQARAHDFDAGQVESLFRELEFRTLLKALDKLTGSGEAAADTLPSGPRRGEKARGGGQMSMFVNQPVLVESSQRPASIEVKIVNTPAQLADLAAALSGADVLAFDTETTSTDEMRAELVGISFATRAGAGYYVPIGHRGAENLPLEVVLSALRGPLTNRRLPKVAHHAKYDYLVLARHGVRVTPITFDTMLAEFVVDPDSRQLGLKNMVSARLDEDMTHIEDLIGSGRSQISMADVPLEAAAAYAAADAEATLRLMPILEKELGLVSGSKVLAEIDVPLVPVLAEMELAGILLDLPLFAEMEADLRQRMAQIEASVFELIGKPFNLNSTQQLSEMLFSRLGLQPPDRGRKTASGHYSTSADVLESLRGKHEVVDRVLEHRELSKLKSTYVDALPAAVDEQTGRVHTSYSQTGAVTGRLSSSNPNLQNIPIRTEEGRRIRNGFIAPPGSVLLSVDYSQIELRIVAHMAKDEAMLSAFRAGEDIHATTAAAIYGVQNEEVTKEMRRHAKAVNFGLIYGMSPYGLMNSTGLTLAEAENFVKAYFGKFPAVKNYLDGIRELARTQGYVETLLGRRRYFRALQAGSNPALRARAEREAINSPIQGTAADIMKLAMLHMPRAMKTAGLSARMLLQVHDELVLECPRAEMEAAAAVAQETMASAYPLSIPLSTEARWGPNWGNLQPV